MNWMPGAHHTLVQGRSGKARRGTHKPTLILHTTETARKHALSGGGRFPNYTSPPHVTFDPSSGETHQHVPFGLASYAVWNEAVERAANVYQVELIANAADVPNYDDNWYRNLAGLVSFFTTHMGVPPVFADFTVMRYGRNAPQGSAPSIGGISRGIMGHAHVPDHPGGSGERHWDPGHMNVQKVQRFMQQVTPSHDAPIPYADLHPSTHPHTEEYMPTELWHLMIDSLYAARPDQFKGDKEYWKSLDPHSPEWADWFAAFARALTTPKP